MSRPFDTLQSYVTRGGVSGAEVIPAGTDVTGIAARAAVGVLTATIQVAAQPALSVPDGGALSLDPVLDPRTLTPTLRGPVTITFVDTASYVVETLV